MKTKYVVIPLWIPDTEFETTVKTLRFNDYRVDDMCSTNSKHGRLVNIWVPFNELLNEVSPNDSHIGPRDLVLPMFAENKPGYFMGEEPE